MFSTNLLRRERGNALLETMVVVLALAPFFLSMVLLGKQLDVKHKTYDALRYSTWERTVWSSRGSNAKADEEITVEAMDRAFGHPSAGISSLASLRESGISQNPLWRDHQRQSLLAGTASEALSATYSDNAAPVEAGYALVPGLAHGDGVVAVAARAMQMDDLGLNRRAFLSTTVEARVRPLLAQLAARSTNEHSPVTQQARGAVLSDTWSSRDEGEFRRRVDRVTADELIETLEMPGRAIAVQSPGKGGPLYGEGQYSWEPDLQPRSNALPAAYVTDREGG